MLYDVNYEKRIQLLVEVFFYSFASSQIYEHCESVKYIILLKKIVRKIYSVIKIQEN